jgi:predicted enzyme related to lactoylglutathione lyase
MTPTRTYPHGVPSWVDTEQPDPEAAQDFYSQLFGWTFETVSPPGTPMYAIATLDGRDVAGLARAEAGRPAAWNTYIATDDADATAARVTAAGGEVLVGPFDPGPAGRTAFCRDSAGAEFRLWQAGRRLGAQAVNEPGSWNFSYLHTDRRDEIELYVEVFGWAVEDLGFAPMVRVPGYGDHLEATVDPGIRARHQSGGAPPGFSDAITFIVPLEPGMQPHWQVAISVADRDAALATAKRLGAEVLGAEDTQWTRTALIRDPQGAVFTASQFRPPE